MIAATALQTDTFAEPLDVLTVRAETRAYLFGVGEFELIEAVDELQDYAERSGLVARIGQDEVQSIIATAFAPYREAAPQ